MSESKGRKSARARLVRMGYKAGGHVKAKDAVVKGVHAHEKRLHRDEKPTPAKMLKDGGCAEGSAPKMRADRLARGGKPKGKTVVNVIVGGHGQQQPQAVPVPKPVPVPVPVGGVGPGAGPGPGGIPAAGPAPMPIVPPDQGGAPPPGLKTGGRARNISGRNPIKGIPAGHFKRGGKTGYPISGGAAGGLARLEKAKAESKRPGGKR